MIPNPPAGKQLLPPREFLNDRSRIPGLLPGLEASPPFNVFLSCSEIRAPSERDCMRPSGETDDAAGILLHNDPHLKVEGIRSGDDVEHVGLVRVPVLEVRMNPVLSHFRK